MHARFINSLETLSRFITSRASEVKVLYNTKLIGKPNGPAVSGFLVLLSGVEQVFWFRVKESYV